MCLDNKKDRTLTGAGYFILFWVLGGVLLQTVEDLRGNLDALSHYCGFCVFFFFFPGFLFFLDDVGMLFSLAVYSKLRHAAGSVGGVLSLGALLGRIGSIIGDH